MKLHPISWQSKFPTPFIKLVLLLAGSLQVILNSPLSAQPFGDLPTDRYYAARDMLRIGDIFDAATGFREVLTLAKKNGRDGWIDSVPSMVQLAECHYHQGEIAKALELYDGALSLILQYPNWLDQFNLGENVVSISEPGLKGVNWFKLTTPSTTLAMPPGVQMRADFAQARTDQQGNLIAPMQVTARLDATEVLRTIGVALLRRWQLLGPLNRYSPMTGRMIDYFNRNTNQTQPWAQASWLTLRGLANLSLDDQLAIQQLQNSTYINNKNDYYLTPLALFAQAESAARKGQYQTAILLLQDASVLAAQQVQYDLLSEILLRIGDCACANERLDLIEPLQAAAKWSEKKSLFAQLGGLNACAELMIYAGNHVQARKLANQQLATFKVSKGSPLPRYQARLAYIESLLAFIDKLPTAGWNRINEALTQMRGSAASGPIPPAVFQQQLTLNLLARGDLTAADGDQALSELLAEPDKSQWELRPLETLATLTTAAVPAYQRFLKMADPADQNRVLQRMNLVQQRQVFEALPLAGRALAWKQAIMTEPAALPEDVRAMAQLAMQQQPQLEQLPLLLRKSITLLRSSPLQLDERMLKGDQKQAFQNMEDLAGKLEAHLMVQSLSRKALRRFLPGQFDLEAVQLQLEEGDLLLGMVDVGDQLFIALISKSNVLTWKINDSAAVAANLVALYRQIGLTRAGGKLNTPPTDSKAEWRTTAKQLYAQLFGQALVVNQLQLAKRLIIAPHAKLWYMPFELLIGPNNQPLVASTPISYIPTMSSVNLVYGSPLRSENSLLLLGTHFATDKTANQRLCSLVSDTVDSSSIIQLDQKQTIASPNLLRIRSDELYVFAPLDAKQDNAALRALPIENLAKNRLNDWLASPLQTPSLIVLPTIETAAKNGDLGNGSELFMPVCSLLLNGSQGVISRWSVSGESSSRFWQRARMEFASFGGISAGLRRASIALWAEEFNTSTEPVLHPVGNDSDLLTSGEHPLFWAGYMAIGDRKSQ
jgi:CHAT domain